MRGRSAHRIAVGILAAVLAISCATAPQETPREPGDAATPEAGTPASRAAKTLARKILDATGVQGGIVVHVGCGDGRLTAALRATDAYLVHGLARSATNVESARKLIRSAGLYGKVSVDLPAGEALP